MMQQMGEVQWIKIYIDMFDKRKIKKLRRLPAGNDLLLIWIMLLAMAGKCNAGGMIFITESVPFTEEDLADELDFEVNTIKLAIAAFEELDMIETTKDGFLNVIGWEEYQNIDKLAELRAKDRERKRLKRQQAKALLENSTDVHGMSTECPHIEEEKERDKEKEYHSFIHSAKSEEDFKWENPSIPDDPSLSPKLEYCKGTLGQGLVLMSDVQFSDLCDKLSLDEIHKYFNIIIDCEKKGKHFKKKSHYQAILEMAMKDRKIKRSDTE
jgi:predicted phage replisome organizer